MLDEKHLKLCLTIFNRIHKIQEKGVYSYSEVSNVLKLIENIRNEFGDSDSLDKGIEYYYKNLPNTDIGYHMLCLSMLRYPFHKVLKDAGQNPLK